jgi:hypothetical protein
MNGHEDETEALAAELFAALGWSGCAGASWDLTQPPYRQKWLDMADALAPLLARVAATARAGTLAPILTLADEYAATGSPHLIDRDTIVADLRAATEDPT